MRGRRGGPPPVQVAPAQPPTAEPEGEKKEGENDEKKKEEEPEEPSVKRPEKPPRVPDPREFDVALDDKGRVPPFNFIGQPWPDVLQWLANISKCSLDWQELPSDYLNLTTQRAYALDEVRDLINRHLHARGYTMLQGGEVLSVFKIDKLDPSLLRRVSEEELYDLKPYDFVKVTFELPNDMEVEKAKEDVKQVLSPSAKVFPLVTTRRLLIFDTVANLRLVSALLNEERSRQDGRIVPREFVLKYARPEQVIDILYVVLGMDPKSRPTQMELQLQQQRLQLMSQMQQQGKDVASMLQKDGPPVYLAYNRQRNSVLANAPPEQMRVIERTIEYLDVPLGDVGAVGSGDEASSVVGARVMKKYPLTTLDPQNFVLTLEEIGGLSPYSDFRVDAKSKTLFALATEADHKKINSLIGQFDGTGRKFEVIWLRRLPADAVAATINKLMAGQTEEEEQEDRSPWFFSWRDRNEDEKPEKLKGFGVDADIENNRLLLWADEAELERVRDLLVKLGEIPGSESDPRQVRFVEPSDGGSTEQLLEQLRAAWSASGKNELIINLPDTQKPDASPDETAPRDDNGDGKVKPISESALDRSTNTVTNRVWSARLAQLEVPSESAPYDRPTESAEPLSRSSEPEAVAATTDDTADTSPPPVTITVTNDGRLMISSPDTDALDRMEDLLAELSPPERRYKVYRLKYIKAANMYWNLYDFFEQDLEGDTETMLDWFGRTREYGKKDTTTGLARRRKLMITYDISSNAVMVANASPRQLDEVEQLIAEFDRPASLESINRRRTAAVKIRHSKASVIANALKEVYRDLLSSRDREFDNGEQGERRQIIERTTIMRFGQSADSSDNSTKPVKVGFEGALSVGVDEISNIVLISVQEELFDNVMAMVKLLDEEAAQDTTVQVHRLRGAISAEALQKALDEAMGTPWVGGRPEKQPQAEQPEDREGRDRDRDRDRSRDRRRGDGDRGRGDRD